jgi:hypothetical protein
MFGDQSTQRQFDPSTFFSLLVHLSILIFSYMYFFYFFKATPTSIKKNILTTKCIEKTLKMTQIYKEHIFFIYCLKILQK